MTESRPLSVLVVGVKWPPETFLARLFRGWLIAGFQVTIALTRQPEKEWLEMSGFRWLPIFAWTGSPLGRFWHITRLYAWARIHAAADVHRYAITIHQKNSGSHLRAWQRLLPFAGGRWDILYAPWLLNVHPYLVLSSQVKSLVISNRGSQINVTPHDPQRQRTANELQTVFDKATAVHCVSENIKQEALNYGLDPAKTWVIRPAVDPDYFTPVPERENQPAVFRVVTTGGLGWVKGHEYALVAIRHLMNMGIPVQFTLIGDGPERQRLLYTIDDLNLQEQVILVGRQSPEQVRTHLQKADAFLLSSVSEGISNAVLEAMACGLPVVTTDCGGMAEAVTDGREGFVVPVRDATAMAQALQTLWHQPALRQQMGQAARQRICAEFTLTRQVGLFAELLWSVTSRAS